LQIFLQNVTLSFCCYVSALKEDTVEYASLCAYIKNRDFLTALYYCATLPDLSFSLASVRLGRNLYYALSRAGRIFPVRAESFSAACMHTDSWLALARLYSHRERTGYPQVLQPLHSQSSVSQLCQRDTWNSACTRCLGYPRRESSLRYICRKCYSVSLYTEKTRSVEGGNSHTPYIPAH
jgi:hypothetical protein